MSRSGPRPASDRGRTQLATAWQDLAQLKSRYKSDWQTILNNSGAVLAFAMGHWAAAKEMAEVLGWEPAALLRLKADEAALSVRNEGTRKILRVNYLTDQLFAGMADPNPYDRRQGGPRGLRTGPGACPAPRGMHRP